MNSTSLFPVIGKILCRTIVGCLNERIKYDARMDRLPSHRSSDPSVEVDISVSTVTGNVQPCHSYCVESSRVREAELGIFSLIATIMEFSRPI
jgi:hypothetical protein